MKISEIVDAIEAEYPGFIDAWAERCPYPDTVFADSQDPDFTAMFVGDPNGFRSVPTAEQRIAIVERKLVAITSKLDAILGLLSNQATQRHNAEHLLSHTTGDDGLTTK